MKMSILLGIAQMNLGLILSFFNARFFGSSLDIRFVFFFTLSSEPSEFVHVFKTTGMADVFVMCHQVSVYTSDDLFEQPIWLPFTAHHHQVVHWISSRLVSCNDLHVSESHR